MSDVSLAVTIKGEVTSTWLDHLRSIAPHFGEVVVVSSDASALEQVRGLDLSVLLVRVRADRDRHPELYYRDEVESYSVNRPLVDEAFSGPHTGDHVVADWSAVRDLGWSRCTLGWRVPLTSDEVLGGAESVSALAEEMRAGRRQVAYARHVSAGGHDVFRPVLVENVPDFEWEGAASEHLTDGTSGIAIAETIAVSCSRSLVDLAADFRALYADARRRDWDVPPRALVDMARLAPEAGMAHLVPDLVRRHLDESLDVEERAWACALAGEYCEELGQVAEAQTWYARSVGEHAGAKALLRLSRVCFKRGDSGGCLEAFKQAALLRSRPYWRDDGAVDLASSLLLTNASLVDLGYAAEARANCDVLHRAFEGNPHVDELCRRIAP